MMHDFSLTEHYVVLYDLPVTFNTALEDVAIIHLPARVPQGFHGNWIPASG